MSRAGAGGTLALYKEPPARAARLVREVVAGTVRPFGVNVVPEVTGPVGCLAQLRAVLPELTWGAFLTSFGLPTPTRPRPWPSSATPSTSPTPTPPSGSWSPPAWTATVGPPPTPSPALAVHDGTLHLLYGNPKDGAIHFNRLRDTDTDWTAENPAALHDLDDPEPSART
ncbi:hypothetical protein ACIO13_12085 [Streptomyces sp. NPDC087425]|uniref:hypothetical protein n=1 Tax=Streptomyces sp. NPDC087425 TaxID=3365787 RepID=UPI0038012BC0